MVEGVHYHYCYSKYQIQYACKDILFMKLFAILLSSLIVLNSFIESLVNQEKIATL